MACLWGPPEGVQEQRSLASGSPLENHYCTLLCALWSRKTPEAGYASASPNTIQSYHAREDYTTGNYSYYGELTFNYSSLRMSTLMLVTASVAHRTACA